ncbi:MAG TPA: hypothetical protein VGE76_10925 [Opitutaceae bacterium]
MSEDFNPNSTDAVLARVLEKLEGLEATAQRIEAHAIKTNGRVTSLEHWRTAIKSKVALVSGGVAAAATFAGWCIDKLFPSS